MEIFQTIWSALTNENELLSRIVFIPITFLETYINMLLFTTLLKINASKSNKLKYILFFSTLGTTFNIFIPNPYRSFINLALLLVCTKIFFKTKIIKTILIPLGETSGKHKRKRGQFYGRDADKRKADSI